MKPVAPLPEVVIEADGSTLATEDLQALSEVRVQQRLSLPTLCELVFVDISDSLASVTRLMPGTTLRVLVRGKQVPLFIGQVTAVEHCYAPNHGREIRVRGYDLLHQLRKRQSVRAHIQVTVQDLARELVADLGLTVQAARSERIPCTC